MVWAREEELRRRIRALCLPINTVKALERARDRAATPRFVDAGTRTAHAPRHFAHRCGPVALAQPGSRRYCYLTLLRGPFI